MRKLRAPPADGVFAPLQDPEYFAQARVEPDIGTVVWPNGANLDPMVLHATITGQAIQVAKMELASRHCAHDDPEPFTAVAELVTLLTSLGQGSTPLI